MMLFFVLLTLGFIFELGKNALSIDSKQTSLSSNPDTSVYAFYSMPLKSGFLFESGTKTYKGKTIYGYI
jgi:hypothetical protein